MIDMDSNTLLVIIVDGGLILFFLYALYYISQLVKHEKSRDPKPTIKQDKKEPTVVKVKEYEPTYTPSPVIREPEIETKEETTEPTIHETEKDDTIITTSTSEPVATPSTHVLDESLQGINIIDVEGIGSTYETRLNNIGIYTVGDLLSDGATPNGRKTIAEETEISSKLILEWVNICDLYRISGVGEEYSDLLEEAGVDTVPELARRNPENLHTKMSEVNEEKNLVRRLPSVSDVERWVEEAKKLPRVIEY